MILKFWLESAFTYDLNFVVYLDSEYHLFSISAVFEFKAQVQRTLYVRVYECKIQNYTTWACWNTIEWNSILNVNSETSKGRGLLVMI
jgi:hypothetical protein